VDFPAPLELKEMTPQAIIPNLLMADSVQILSNRKCGRRNLAALFDPDEIG